MSTYAIVTTVDDYLDHKFQADNCKAQLKMMVMPLIKECKYPPYLLSSHYFSITDIDQDTITLRFHPGCRCSHRDCNDAYYHVDIRSGEVTNPDWEYNDYLEEEDEDF